MTNSIAARDIHCGVVKVESLGGDIVRVWLRDISGKTLQYRAGQYVDILLEDGRKRSYSLASAPTTKDASIELHIRSVTEGGFADEIITRIRSGGELQLRGPLGRGSFSISGDRPIVLVAGGTGFAPIKSIIEASIEGHETAMLTLYWGVRTRADLYLHDLALEWERNNRCLHYVPVLSEPRVDDEWTGRTGLVHEAVLGDIPDLSQHTVYASGPLPMVHALRDAFIVSGLPADKLYSDLI